MEHSATLVVFTFLSQIAIGGFITLFLLEMLKKNISSKASFISLVTILACSVVAVIVSVFHLGHPFAAYRALYNFGHSWLSREIVFFPTFIFFVFVYAFLAKSENVKQIAGILGSVFGVVTIFCTAMIYTIPAMPAWDNGLTASLFFITALLVGPFVVQLVVAFVDKKVMNFSIYTAIIAGVVIIVNFLNITIMNGSFVEATQTAELLMASPMFWTKMALLVVGFVLSIVSLVDKKKYTAMTVAAMFACFFIADLLGRILFYSTGVHL